MINKAFDTINARLAKALEPKGFKKQAVSSAEGNKMLSLYISDAIAYSVMYDPDKKVMLLNSCLMSDGEPDNDWKAVSTWMFDPETDEIKQAEDIARDFIDTVDTDKKVVLKQKRKRVKGEDGNGDPIFFFKRLVVLFPELKDEIRYEELNYVPFRAVTFAREHVVERINSLIASKDKAQMRKLAEILGNQYSYGDLDVRSVITIVILNSIPSDYIEMFNSYLNEDMQKAWKNALKFKNKKVKPEKEKKVRSFISDTLKNSQ
ncbi:MAG: hypothetical protein PUC88_04575 [Clostridia bacterium]|nr:hypothetical protein [Clostridia bacterium]